MATALQKLHDVCKATFTLSSPPSPQALQRVHAVLDSIQSSDVGLHGDSVEQQKRGFGLMGGRRGRHSLSARFAPPISYLHLYESEAFSMGIFCIPTSAGIPLHDHPDMTVLSKLLYGSLHVKAFDWVNSFDDKLNGGAPPRPRLAKLVIDRIMTAPCQSTVLHPNSGGNIHAFTAVTPCAVLDVLAPPYATSAGRNCTYYRESLDGNRHGGVPAAGGLVKNCENMNENDKGCSWLEECQPADDFVLQRGIYRGPMVVP